MAKRRDASLRQRGKALLSKTKAMARKRKAADSEEIQLLLLLGAPTADIPDDWLERIKRAKEARDAGAELREGKSASMPFWHLPG